jgi:hypothetical protein
MLRPFSATGPPSQAWWPQCARTAKRSGRLATASSACHTERDGKTAKPRQEGTGGERIAV